MMKASIKLFRIFGIQVSVHITFLLLPLFIGLSTLTREGMMHALRSVILIFSVFFWVILHEVCHSIQARKRGGIVSEIILLPIGGISSMRGIPDKPRDEFAIAISGPLFNFISAAVLFYPAYLLLGTALLRPSLDSWESMAASIYWINPTLGLFNLLPAFPMDGGRVLRSVLAQQMDYRKATGIAVRLGKIFAIGLGLWGLFGSSIILVLIAIFVYFAASQEEERVSIKAALKKFYVKDILSGEFIAPDPDISLNEILKIMFYSHQENFPVVETGRLLGFLTRGSIISAIHQFGTEGRVREVMMVNFPTVSPSDSLEDANKLMQESGLKALPVLEDGRVVGVVTLEDVARVYIITSAAK
jgi:Zn-dependent protease